MPKGKLSCENACPLANYFHAKFPQYTFVVNEFGCEFYDVDEKCYSAEFSEEIVKFIARFDGGEYPQLIVD